MSEYIHHLAQINDTLPVSAKENICNKQGVVLLEQARLIDKSKAALLVKHALISPIENLVELKEEFTADTFYELFNEFILSDDQFQCIYELRDLDEVFVACIEHFCSNEVLRQKLSVLFIQAPNVFDRALFCAWIATVIYAYDHQSQEKLNAAFLAGLTHDLGLLDIAPELAFKEEPLSINEWNILQEHPLLGADALSRLEGVDPEVVRAVAEHHETVDGTGYPKNKMLQQLGELGRLIHMLDSVYAIYTKHLRPRKRTFKDLIPILQIATLSRGGRHSATLLLLLRKAPETNHHTIPEALVDDLIQWVKAATTQIMQFVDITNTFRRKIGTQHHDLKLFALQNMARHVRSTLTSCGIINAAYIRWLDQVQEQKLEFAYRELEDVSLMILEIQHHMECFDRMVDIFLPAIKNDSVMQLVEKLKEDLSNISICEPEHDLKSYVFCGG